MNQTKNLNWQFTFSSFILWRVLLFLTALLAPYVLEYKPSFPYAYDMLPKYGLPQWLYSWANFDGVHYLTIVEKGYLGTGLIQAFFPLYPFTIKLLNFLVHNSLISSLIITTLAACASFYLFYILIKKQFSEEIAKRSFLFFIIFPTSFYLGSVYGESFFISLVCLTFLFLHQKKWLYAGVAAGFASASRIVGICLVFSILTEVYLTTKKRDKIEGLVAAGIASLGLLTYMTYLWYQFNDPLFFLHVQSEFGSGREETIVLLPQVFYRAIRIIITVPFDLRWITYFQELLYTALAFILLTVGLLKKYKVPLSWIVFSFLAILIPTLTGTFSSMPRYVLVAFPIFVILSLQIKQSWLLYLIYFVSGVALIFNTVLFIQGYWVA